VKAVPVSNGERREQPTEPTLGAPHPGRAAVVPVLDRGRGATGSAKGAPSPLNPHATPFSPSSAVAAAQAPVAPTPASNLVSVRVPVWSVTGLALKALPT
jgi:hypothetical protein